MFDDKLITIIILLVFLVIIYLLNYKEVESFKGASIEYGTGHYSGTGNNVVVYDRGPYTYNQTVKVDGKDIPVVRQACGDGCSTSPNMSKESDDYKKPDSGRYERCLDGKSTNAGCKIAFDNFFHYDTWQKDKKTLFLKSYGDFGFNCNLGKGTNPLKYDDKTGVLSCISLDGKSCLNFTSKDECVKRLNLVPYNSYPADATLAEPATTTERKLNNAQVINCDKGKDGDFCEALYNYVGYQSFEELGFKPNDNIYDGKILGKKNETDTAYKFASYDEKNFISSDRKKFPPTKDVKPAVCSEYNSKLDSKYPDACYQAYKEFSLFPSSSPLTIKGNNLEQGVPNTITDTTKLKDIYTNYPSVFNDPKANYGDPVQISQGITNALKGHPMMFYCCNRASNKDKTVKERVPLDPTIDYSKYTTDMAKYGFDFKSIAIDPKVCPTDLAPASSACDNFMALHCENIFNQMTKQNLDIYKDLSSYAPECACFAPKKPTEAQYQNVPSICFKDRCQANTGAYLDPTSYTIDSTGKKTTASCNMTICTNIVDTSGVSAGGSANITPNLQNNCGPQIDAAKDDAAQKASTSPSTSNNSNTSNTTNTSTPSIPTISTLIPTSTTTSSTDTNTDTSNEPSTDNSLAIIGIILCICCVLCSSLSLVFRR